MSSRVFIVQQTVRKDPVGSGRLVPVFNVEPAREFGELVTLLSPSAQPWNPGPIIEELHEKLEDFSEEDWLLCLGSPILIGWAAAIAADYGAGQVGMLQWRGDKRRYDPVKACLWSPH